MKAIIADILGILMWIDTGIYKIAGWIYEIFLALAKTNIFDKGDYKQIVSRIYAVLGVIMMFVLAYSLLKAVINPDEFAKGDKGDGSFPKLIKNVVVSLAIIAFLPTIFTVAFNIQNSILNNNTIGAIINGADGDTTYNPEHAGKYMSFYVMNAFLHPNYDKCDVSVEVNEDINKSTCAKNINSNGGWGVTNGESWASIYNKFVNDEDGYTISKFNDFGEAAADGKITYDWGICFLAGFYLIIVLANFCIDMGTRVVKLMYFQVIAPIPVVCRIIPGGKFKDVFGEWMRKTINTYLDVFIRLIIIYFGFYMSRLVVDNWDKYPFPFPGLGSGQRLLAKACLLLGIVTFMRQAPKLISEMFHLDAGGMKLHFGVHAATAGVGGAMGTGIRNAVSAVKNFRGAKGGKAKVAAALSGIASVAAGTTSGAVRGFKRGFGAKNLHDVRQAAGGAVAAASASKAEREKYIAEHRSDHGVTDTIGNVMKGFIIDDPLHRAKRYFGATGLEELQEDNKTIDDINSKKKAIRTAAEDLIIGESNKQGVAKNFGLTSKAKINGRDVDFDTAILRSMRQEMETARASGAANAGVLQDEYDSYLKQFTDAVQNQALLGEENYNSFLAGLGKSSLGVRADLSEVRSAASNFRRSLKDNLTASYVSGLGFNASNLADDSNLNLKDELMDKLGDTLKVAKQKNIDEINKIINNQQKQNEKK